MDEDLKAESWVLPFKPTPMEWKFHFTFSVDMDGVDTTIKLTLTPDEWPPGKYVAAIRVPTTAFKTKEEWAEYIMRVETNFRTYVHLAMAAEALQTFHDAGESAFTDMGLTPGALTPKEILGIHVNATKNRVAKIVGAKGRRSKWTRAELERDVRSAMRALKRGDRNLSNVADVLRARKPDKAPVSGEALGVLLKRFRIPWKDIKTD